MPQVLASRRQIGTAVRHVGLVVTLFATSAAAQSGQNLERPGHWKTRYDDGAAVTDRRFVVMRPGVEIKRVDAPRRTPSMTAALRDLSLDALYVLYPGELRSEIGERITAVPTAERFSLEAPA